MKNETIGVIGSTGKTGSRVLEQLKKTGVSTRALSRKSQHPFDWQSKNSWVKALTGVDSLYVTYVPDLAVPQAKYDIKILVDVAKSVGVKHIVLLSGRGEEGAQAAEKIVINSGIHWNIVRASWFMQNFSESFMVDGIQAGELVLPEPKATEPFIDAEDIADIAFASLTRSELRNQLFEITGPELLSFSQCVQEIASAAERQIIFSAVPIDKYLAGAAKQGLPKDIAWLINELFVSVLDGRNEQITDTIAHILGRPARTFKDYVASVKNTGVWMNSSERVLIQSEGELS